MQELHDFFAKDLRSLPMPELRKDPIVGRWVIIATERAKRPVAPKPEPQSGDGGFCPFCEGQEDKTPMRSSPTAIATPGPTKKAGASAWYPTNSPLSKWKGISTSAATAFMTR